MPFWLQSLICEHHGGCPDSALPEATTMYAGSGASLSSDCHRPARWTVPGTDRGSRCVLPAGGSAMTGLAAALRQ